MRKPFFSPYRVFFYFLLALAPARVLAQDPFYINYSVNNGLPSSEAYCVMQEKKGYIWVSTDAGIARFDGYKFKTYTTENGLADNTVFGLYEDHRGRIWCVSHSGRICYYKNEKFYTLPCNDTLAKKIGSSHALAVDVDSLDNIYINCKDKGIYQVKPPYRPQDIVLLINRQINLYDHILVRYNQNYMVMGGLGDIVMVKKGRRQLVKTGAERFHTYSRIYGRNNRVYTSRDKVVYLLEGHRLRDSVEVGSPVISLYEDKKGNLWVGTLERGIYFFRAKDLRTPPRNYFRHETVSSIMEDAEGGVWFTSIKNSLFYLPYPEVINFREKSFLEVSKVNSVVNCDNRIVAGKANGELLIVDPEWMQDSIIVAAHNEAFSNVRSGNAIVNLEKGGQDTLMVLGQRSFMYDPRHYRHLGFFTLKVRNDPCPLFSKAYGRFSPSTFFLAGTAQLMFYRNNRMNAFFPFSPSRINTVKNKGSSIWIATHEGLWMLKDSVLHHYADSLPQLRNRIDQIEIMRNGQFLLATKAAGLLIWDPQQKKVRSITVKEGLPGNTCKNLFLENDSILWIATNKGLCKMNIAREKILFNYTTDHGLPSNEINGVCADGRYIWVATSHGLSAMDRQESFKNTTRPGIYITGMKADTEKIVPGEDAIILGENPQQLSITFNGICYKSLGKCVYKYKLQGLHSRWYYTRTPSLEFSSLDPGNYTLEIFAINNSGISSLFPARLRFTIPAPVWQKAWFIVLVALLFVALVYGLFRMRLNLVRKRASKEAALNRSLMNLKLKALRAQMNPHFTFNVMNSIQHFILEKDEESAQLYLSKFSKLIRAILQHSEEDQVSLAEEIRALELYLELEVMRFEQRFDYEIKVDPSIPVNQVKIPSMLIQPYVENAIKHGILPLKGKGMIRIVIENQGKTLRCTVEDNGVGRMQAATRTQHAEHKSMGTSITKERLSVINALNNIELSEKIIDLEDEKGNATGTRVEIYIPWPEM